MCYAMLCRSNAGDDTAWESGVGREAKAGDDITGNSDIVNMPPCLFAPVYSFAGENVRLGTIFLWTFTSPGRRTTSRFGGYMPVISNPAAILAAVIHSTHALENN